jgi:hypothetical protein
MFAQSLMFRGSVSTMSVMVNNTPLKSQPSPAPPRKAYSPPQLVVHGTVSALTETASPAKQSESTKGFGSQSV